jgi:hypothetical protein
VTAVAVGQSQQLYSGINAKQLELPQLLNKGPKWDVAGLAINDGKHTTTKTVLILTAFAFYTSHSKNGLSNRQPAKFCFSRFLL